MAYSTQAQIQGEFKDVTFTASTAVTDTEVAELISQTDAEIDARLSVRYVVPVTGPTSLLLLRTISIYITAARVSKIIEVKTGESDRDQPRRVEERNTALRMLQEIIDGKIILTDAEEADPHRGVRSYTYENNITPCIQTTRDQW